MDESLWTFLIESFPKIILPGLKITLPLTAAAFTWAFCIAIVNALIQFANIPVLKQASRLYVWIMRGTPLMIQLYIVFFGLPSVGVVIDPIPSALIVFAMNEGAYCTETIRGCLESVPKGQLEAGYCVGMSYPQTMRRVVLPQALKTAFPSLSNSFICMVKDMSLTASISVAEMFYETQRLLGRTYKTLALYAELAVVYLIFCTVLTLLQRLIERKLGIGQPSKKRWQILGRLAHVRS